MSGRIGQRLTQRATHRGRRGKRAQVIDLTVCSASDDELRRRAAEGNQQAIAEQTRRRAEAESWARAA